MANITPGQILASFNGTLTQGSNQLTNVDVMPTSFQYYPITATGTGTISANTFINSLSGSTITMSKTATASGNATFSVVATRIQREDTDFLTVARQSKTNRQLGWG